MPLSKDNFINRMQSYDKAVSSEAAQSKALTEIEHNLIAKLFRNGLSIIGFTILEDFLKTKVGEIFKVVGTSTVSFTRLPETIQEASTLSAIKSIQNRAQTMKKSDEDWLAFIQDESFFIGSTKSSAYELSAYSLGWEKSNLVASDISNFLGCFCVKGGWDSIQKLSIAANITLASPSDSFKNAAMRRHNSAHNANADSPINDLFGFSNEARIIAFCFDVLISKSLFYLMNNNVDFLEGRKQTLPTDIKIRFLIEHNTTWKEYSQTSSRAFRTNTDYATILAESKARALNKGETLIIKDKTNKIVNWFIH